MTPPNPSVCPKCGASCTISSSEPLAWSCGSRIWTNLDFSKKHIQSDRCRIAELTAEVERLREQNAVLERVAEAAMQIGLHRMICHPHERSAMKKALAALDHPAPQKPETDDE